MTTLTVLAGEALTHKTWWNPSVKGILIFALAVGLFTGSAYLLLYTNVGTRLGFLLTAAAFTGFLTVLTVFWITGQFPNGPKGHLPGWPVKEILSEPSESTYEAVRDIERTGDEADSAAAGQIRADLDKELTDSESPFKLFGDSADYLAVKTYTKGGGRKWPMWWTEKTTYGAARICSAAEPDVLPLEPPPTPECDTSKPVQWAVVVKDLGAERLPSFLFFGGASLLFALALLALHRYEQDTEKPEPAGADKPEGPKPEGPEPEPEPEPEREPEPEPVEV